MPLLKPRTIIIMTVTNLWCCSLKNLINFDLLKNRKMTPKSSETAKLTNGYNTHLLLPREIGTDYSFKREIVWFNAIGFLILHLCALFGLYLCTKAHIYTNFWMVSLLVLSGEGVTLGAHRLYSHKAFKASFIVRFTVLLLHTIAGQNCLYIWVRDHRQHHKYSDTDADPHNANRGFFFSHVGWLMSRKHPAVISKGKTIDLSDLEADSLVMLQKQFYKPLYVIFALAIPVAIPVYFWQETYFNSLFISYFARYIIMLNATWLINSANHMFGLKPYDKNINPVENAIVSFFSLGEGWHNYHHAFPSDYKAAEYGLKYSLTTATIDMLAYFGLVYDLKQANPEIVKNLALKKGDGTHPVHRSHEDDEIQSEESTNNENVQHNNNNNEEDLLDSVDLNLRHKISANG